MNALGPALNLVNQARFVHIFGKRFNKRTDIFITLNLGFVEFIFNVIIVVGLQVFGGQVFQFCFYCIKPQPVCQGGVNISRFRSYF